jgi:hypothetical protein
MTDNGLGFVGPASGPHIRLVLPGRREAVGAFAIDSPRRGISTAIQSICGIAGSTARIGVVAQCWCRMNDVDSLRLVWSRIGIFLSRRGITAY